MRMQIVSLLRYVANDLPVPFVIDRIIEMFNRFMNIFYLHFIIDNSKNNLQLVMNIIILGDCMLINEDRS